MWKRCLWLLFAGLLTALPVSAQVAKTTVKIDGMI